MNRNKAQQFLILAALGGIAQAGNGFVAPKRVIGRAGEGAPGRPKGARKKKGRPGRKGAGVSR